MIMNCTNQEIVIPTHNLAIASVIIEMYNFCYVLKKRVINRKWRPLMFSWNGSISEDCSRNTIDFGMCQGNTNQEDPFAVRKTHLFFLIQNFEKTQIIFRFKMLKITCTEGVTSIHGEYWQQLLVFHYSKKTYKNTKKYSTIVTFRYQRVRARRSMRPYGRLYQHPGKLSMPLPHGIHARGKRMWR